MSSTTPVLPRTVDDIDQDEATPPTFPGQDRSSRKRQSFHTHPDKDTGNATVKRARFTTLPEPNANVPRNPPQGVFRFPLAEAENKDGAQGECTIRHQFIALTYPRCHLTVERFIELFRATEHFPERYIARRKSHALKDGEEVARVDFHVLMDMGLTASGAVKTISSNRAWDLVLNKTSPGGERVYHPESDWRRNKYNAWMFVNKRENPLDVVFTDIERRACFAKPPSQPTAWREVTVGKTEEGMRRALQQLVPKQAVLNHTRIDRFIAGTKSGPNMVWTLRNAYPFKRFEAIEKWVDLFLKKPRRGPQVALWLIGSSRTGKTCWARMQGRHNNVCGAWCPKLLNPNADYNVLDGINIHKFPDWKEMILGTEFTSAGKYVGKRVFEEGEEHSRNGIPSIWTTNYDPRNRKNNLVGGALTGL